MGVSCQPSKFSASSAFSASIPFLAGLIHLICFIQYAFYASARCVIKSVILIMVVAAVGVGSVAGDTWGADTIDGQPVDFEMGDAIYRDLSVVWHAGIYYKYTGGTSTDTKNHLVLHQPGPRNKNGKQIDTPSRDNLDYFIHGDNDPTNEYNGNYTVKELVGNQKNRMKVINTAIAIIDEAAPGYPDNPYHLLWSPSYFMIWQGIVYDGIGREIENIVKIRCDGFVEYCYEKNEFMVWRRHANEPEWAASIIKYPEAHFSFGAWDAIPFTGQIFSPVNQATSINNTRMRPATGTPPAITIKYPNSTNPDIPTYINARTFNVVADATDAESGVKGNTYELSRRSKWLGILWSFWETIGTASSLITTVPEDGLYAFQATVYDWGGNLGKSAITYCCVDTQPPAAPTISSPTHPDSNKPSATNTVTFQWTAPADASGIAGYSYAMDNSPATIPDETIDFDSSCVKRTFYNLPNGTWSFHLREVDNAGNWSTPCHYQVNINREGASASQWLMINNATVTTIPYDKYASYTLTCNPTTPNGRVNVCIYADTGMIGMFDSGDEIISSFFIDDNSHVDEDVTLSKIQITRLIPEGYTGTFTIQAVDEGNKSFACCLLNIPQKVLPQFIAGRASVNGIPKANAIVFATKGKECITTITNNNGEYKLYLSPGEYNLTMKMTGFPIDYDLKKEISLLPNNQISDIDFNITTGVVSQTITGKVKDIIGKGISCARIVSARVSSSNEWLVSYGYTDMDGYYTIYAEPGEEYLMCADAFGYVLYISDFPPPLITAGSKNVDFILTQCKATIIGTVTDKNGNGVLGARINDTGDIIFNNNVAIPTNRFGHYCLYVPEGDTNCSVSAKGIDSAVSCKTANAMATNVNIQLLYHNSTISGKVYEPDGITPLGCAHVSGTWSNTVSEDNVEAYTNPDGSYELRVLDGYNYRVFAMKHGYYEPSSKQNVPAPNTAIDFIMPGKIPGRITGVVRDTMGSPTMGALIEVMKDNIPIATATAISNGSGSYTIMDLPEGAYTLVISRGGYELAATTVTVKADGTSSNDFIMDKNGIFYVDCVVRNYANGSQKYPYQNIQQAVDDCLANDTVLVFAGTYSGSVSVNKCIALIGIGTPTIDASSSAIAVSFNGTATLNALISGFRITGANQFFFIFGSGISCINGAAPNITNNIISGNDGDGIYNDSSSPTIINNTISGNGRDGIYNHLSSPTITNNIITENGIASANYYGIYSGTPIADYNCVWGNGLIGNNNYYDCSAGLHDISVNPQFIGGGNYHLQANSPCINRGTNTLIDLPETDRDGNPRILQTIVDMGAYESFYPGTITGNIFYSGTNTGNLYCLITDKPDSNGNFIAFCNIPVSNSGTFKYEINIQNPGTYYLTCFLDAYGNDNFSLGDMVGIYGSLSCVYLSDTTPVFVGSFTPINIRAGDIISNINVNLIHKISPLYFKVATQHNNTETAGTGFGVTLIVTDYDGNPAGTPTGTLGISCSWNATSSPNKSMLPVKPSDGNIMFTAGNAFLGTFTLVNAEEQPCITVRSDLISGTSSPITVNASSPTTLRFSAPGTVTAGNAFSLGTITACDIFGNTATTYTGNRFLTYSGPGKSPAGISATYTSMVCFNQGISTTLLQTTLAKMETVQLYVTDGSIGGTSTPIIVTHGQPERLNITIATQTITSGATVSCTAIARDTAGNTWTVTAVFSSNDPCGMVAGNIYTAGKAGTWTITGVYAGKTATATIVVLHSTVERLDITPATTTITSGQQATYTVTAKDNQGNTWTVTADTAFSMDNTAGSITTYGTYTAGKAGTWTITGVYAGKTATATIVVLHSTAERLDITPATATVQSGQQATYTATAKDSQGNTWIVTGSSTFGMNDPKGSMTTYGTYTAGKAGTWTITGVYAGKTATTTIVVTHGTATGTLMIELATNTITSGATVSCTATAQDTAGNTWSVTTNTVFSNNDPWRIIAGSSIYIAGKVGTWTITGKYPDLVDGIATVVVTHGMATGTLMIELATHTVTSGAAVSYTAMARDTAGNTWSVTTDTTFNSSDPLRTVVDSSTYIAGKVGTWTITVKYPDLVDGIVMVVVTHSTATGTLMIELATHTVTSGATVNCIATAQDTVGNTWTVTTDTMFGTEDPWGTITGNEYIAGKVGTWIITGTHTATGLVGTSTIVVTPGMAARLEIKPVSSNRWFKNEPGTITISARDKNGNLVATTTTFKLESEGIITPNKATLIKGIATITVSISMAGPVVIIASKGNISGSISLIFVTRKENPNIGTFTTGNGLETRVVIPENTIAADYYVTIGTPTSEMYQKIEVANNRLLSGQKIMPDAIREFNLKDESGTITLPEKTSRVTITIPYADTGDGDIKIDGVRVREDTLRIYRLQNGKWEMVQGEQTQNPAENWICAGVNAFSVFALIGEAYPSDFSQLLVYPNPFKPGSGEKVNFQGLMDDSVYLVSFIKPKKYNDKFIF
ncbi:MAG: carboxypeptidase regulatory-like domain-containing protein [Candidatus Desantisbacteria bacterium]